MSGKHAGLITMAYFKDGKITNICYEIDGYVCRVGDNKFELIKG